MVAKGRARRPSGDITEKSALALPKVDLTLPLLPIGLVELVDAESFEEGSEPLVPIVADIEVGSRLDSWSPS